MESNFKISIVIPVYNEEKQIKHNIRFIQNILINNSISHTIVLIDDGSSDNTWIMLEELSEELLNIHALKLSRNFGKEGAICAGLDMADGDACIIMDSDLQHPPEIIPQMIQLWQNGYEVVDGVKTSRGKESFVNKLGANSFYNILKTFSGINLKNASDFKLMDFKVLSSWRLMNERNTFFRAMSTWVGFKRTTIPFEVADRDVGTSKWSLFKLFKLAITAITSFSSIPLQIVTFLGFVFLIGAIVLGIQTLYMKFRGIAASGFTTVILLQLIIGSAIMISLGIIGTYISKIFDEVKNRPRYIISEEVNSKK